MKNPYNNLKKPATAITLILMGIIMSVVFISAGNSSIESTTQSQSLDNMRWSILNTIRDSKKFHTFQEARLLRKDIETHYQYDGEITYFRYAFWTQKERIKGILKDFNNLDNHFNSSDSLQLALELKEYNTRTKFLTHRLQLLDKKLE